MKKIFSKAGSVVYKKFPLLQPFVRSAYIRFFAKLNFIGWGMATIHAVPWKDDYDWAEFRDTCRKVKRIFELSPSAPSSPVNTDDLMWRHWNVAFAVRKAIKFIEADVYHFVECGVGDGLTSYFTLSEIRHNGLLGHSTMHLYDSWQAMEKERLIGVEQDHEGNYHSLSLDRTQRNLAEFKDIIRYHVGFVPDTFVDAPPEKIVYLHIDLNSSKPTLDALEFFLPRLVNNGIILLDDYGFFDYAETKKLVDQFFVDKPGVLQKLPTGQAIYYHRK